MALSKGTGTALVVLLLAITFASVALPSSTFAGLLRLTGLQSSCPLGYGPGAAVGGNPHFSAASPRGSSSSSPKDPAVVYVNCSVWTADPQNPWAEAFVVRGGRFAFVGTSGAAASAAGRGAVSKTNLQGKIVIPGLIDPHIHLIPGGLSLSRLNLGAVTSKREFIAAVASAARRAEPGQWLLGGNWDESRWGGELPAADWIDAATPRNPVFLTRMDAHQGLANSAALALANITAAAADPPGGLIARQCGRPSGVLSDSAMQLVMRYVPASTVAERRGALHAAEAHALAQGVTAVHDMGRMAFQEGEGAAWHDFEEIYLPAANDGTLRIRLYAFVPLTTWRRMAECVRHIGTTHPGGRLSWGGVKEFADGSLGSRTALMHSPYADDPGNSGTRTVEPKQLRELIERADAAGLQVAVHAIGDKALDEVLDAYAALPPLSAEERPGMRHRRHRVEHAQHLSGAAAAQRMAALGVVATPNPLHLLADSAILGPHLGKERAGAGRAYAFRTLLQAGVRVAFGTDWPVVQLDPMGTLRAAVTRRPGPEEVHGGSGEVSPVWGSQEAVSPEEALAAQTFGAAFAGFQEHSLGSIAVGKHADFVVLGDDPLKAAAGKRPSVVHTYVAGFCEYGCNQGNAATAAVMDEL